jgi:hypothetical protein
LKKNEKEFLFFFFVVFSYCNKSIGFDILTSKYKRNSGEKIGKSIVTNDRSAMMAQIFFLFAGRKNIASVFSDESLV